MKLISFAIPCYNSAAYMSKCIESLLPGGDEVEIIVVDDGSQKDNTLEIAKEYEKKYPGIVKAVHQENGGHGEAVNTGLKNAEGLYFKVVDSDDWLDEEALPKVLGKLSELVKSGQSVDMFLANFIYDKVGQEHKGDAVPYGASDRPGVRLEGCEAFSCRSVYSDAFGHLPYANTSRLWTAPSRAHVLCR